MGASHVQCDRTSKGEPTSTTPPAANRRGSTMAWRVWASKLFGQAAKYDGYGRGGPLLKSATQKKERPDFCPWPLAGMAKLRWWSEDPLDFREPRRTGIKGGCGYPGYPCWGYHLGLVSVGITEDRWSLNKCQPKSHGIRSRGYDKVIHGPRYHRLSAHSLERALAARLARARKRAEASHG